MRKTVGIRPPETSYRLGKEHKISITRLPFHQTGTSAFPLLLAGSTEEATMSPLTNDERQTRLHTGRLRSSSPLNPSSLSVLGRIFGELVDRFFSFPSHAQFPQYKMLQAFSKFFFRLKRCLFWRRKKREREREEKMKREKLNFKCAKELEIKIILWLIFLFSIENWYFIIYSEITNLIYLKILKLFNISCDISRVFLRPRTVYDFN